MKERLQFIHARLSVGLIASMVLALLSIIALTFALSALSDLPAEETMRANIMHQRVIIDAKTGQVSGLGASKSEAFDVSDAREPTPDMGDDSSLNTGSTADVSGTLPRLRDAPEVKETPHVERGEESLVNAPAPEASEKKNEFILPRITSAGLTPSRLYGRGFTRQEGQRVLAIVITDAGFGNDSFAKLLALPKTVTIAVSPYALDAPKKIEALRNAGFETWVMLPTMSESYPKEDPGPLGILSSHPADASIARVHQVMHASPGAVGMVLPALESISAYPEVWNVVLTEIIGRGLYILSTRSDRGLDQLTADKKKQEKIRRADFILDSTPATAFIRSKLSSLNEQFNASSGDMIVIASARPQTLTILGDWLASQRDFTLASLSATYRGYEPPPPPPEKKKSGGH